MGKRKASSKVIISQAELYNILSKENVPARTRSLMSFIYLTGARISEAIEVKKDQLVLEEPFITVYNMRVLKRGKIEVKRTVPIRIETHKDFLVNIFAYTESHRSPYLFPSRRGEHIKARWARKLITKVYAWPHFLRHLRCSHLAQKGLTAYQLKQYMGWARVDTGENYVRLSAEDLRKVV